MSTTFRTRAAGRLAGGLTALAGALTLAGCAPELPEPKPRPPTDMREVVSAFQSPTGELTEETLPDLIESTNRALGLTEDLGELDFVIDFLDGVGDAEEMDEAEGGLRSRRQPIKIGDTELDGEGFLEITRICRGWGAQDEPNRARDGFVNLVMGFTDAGIDPVVFGGFSGCREKIAAGEAEQEVELFLNPTLTIYVGEAFELEPEEGGFRSQPFIFSLEGDSTIDGDEVNLDLDFRAQGDQGIEIRIPSEAGDVIFSPDQQTFRTATGVWQCDFEELQCESEDGERVSFQP